MSQLYQWKVLVKHEETNHPDYGSFDVGSDGSEQIGRCGQHQRSVVGANESFLIKRRLDESGHAGSADNEHQYPDLGRHHQHTLLH